jgi:hypothetical protein
MTSADQTQLRASIVRQLYRRSGATGQIQLPAVPRLIDEYVTMCDTVHDYEEGHLPEGAWPQTNWYLNWTAGLDVFDLKREYCPIDMRWLVYRKTA